MLVKQSDSAAEEPEPNVYRGYKQSVKDVLSSIAELEFNVKSIAGNEDGSDSVCYFM